MNIEIPKNATNLDIIKVLFKVISICEDCGTTYIKIENGSSYTQLCVENEWCNLQYKQSN